MAFVTLYRRQSFVVELGTIDFPESLLTSHEFSTVRQGNAALDLTELYERLSRKK